MATTDNLQEIFDIVDINDKIIGQVARKECNSDTESITTPEKGGLDGDPKGSLYEYFLPQVAKNDKFTSFLFSFERKENKSYNALWQLYNSIRRYICALNDYAMIFA